MSPLRFAARCLVFTVAVVALLAFTFLPAVARAQDLGEVAQLAQNGLVMFVVSAAIVLGVVRFARGFFPAVLAPTPATHRSKAFCRLLALVVGLGLGAGGIAPAVVSGIGGALAGGFLAAAVAVFGRDFTTSGWKAMSGPEEDI